MRQLIPAFLAGTALLLHIGGAAAAAGSSDDVVVFERGHRTFTVPREILSRGDPPSVFSAIINNLPGLDDGSSSFLFAFGGQMAKENIAGYRLSRDRPRVDGLSGIIYVMSPERAANWLPDSWISRYRDVWYQTGRYATYRRVEPAEVPGWYKVGEADHAHHFESYK